jgi:hypothetical protein
MLMASSALRIGSNTLSPYFKVLAECRNITLNIISSSSLIIKTIHQRVFTFEDMPKLGTGFPLSPYDATVNLYIYHDTIKLIPDLG